MRAARSQVLPSDSLGFSTPAILAYGISRTSQQIPWRMDFWETCMFHQKFIRTFSSTFWFWQMNPLEERLFQKNIPVTVALEIPCQSRQLDFCFVLPAEKGTLKVTDCFGFIIYVICVHSIVSLQNEDSGREGRDKALLPADTNALQKPIHQNNASGLERFTHRSVSGSEKNIRKRWIPHNLRYDGRGKRACQDYCKL